MNPLDHSLKRLLNATARARADRAEPTDFSLEARVLSEWRNLEAEDDFAQLLRLFRKAIVFAVLIMSVSGLWNYFENKSGASTTALASYAMKMQLPP